VTLGHYFTAHAKAAYELMEESQDMALARRILGSLENRLRRGHSREFSLHDLYQNLRLQRSDQLLPGLNILRDRGYLRELPSPPAKPGRPASPRYLISPHLNNPPQNPQNPAPSNGEDSHVGFVGASATPGRDEAPPALLMEATI
jgi:hypothetical protein